MANLIQIIKEFFKNREPLPSGFYTYHTKPDDELQYRLHLRIEPDGSGVLIVNASTVLHLNQTAAEYAYAIVNRKTELEAVNEIADRYAISKDTIHDDYLSFREQIINLIDMPDLDPVSYLGMERDQPYDNPTAPYRLDCALTYQVNDADQSAAPTERVSSELSTEEWKIIIRKAFEAGIPHIIFTGGEPTLRDDLAELLRFTEDLGMVTGLLSDGQRLSNPSYLQLLLESGLDHLMYIIDPDNYMFWDELKKILREDLYTTAHLTLKRGQDLKPFLDRLADSHVNSISLSTIDPALEEDLISLRNYAAEKHLDLVWDIPVPYSRLNPVALELEAEEYHSGAGKAYLYLEPDGDVLPAQGINHVIGNLLNNTWDEIWSNCPKDNNGKK